jgi:ABC-type multidrug transport system ATPase subunit
VIQLQDVSKVYRSLIPPKPVNALTGMTLGFEAGEVVGIAGPNGAGKSTLLSLILGFLSPSAGSVKIDGMQPRRFVEHHGMAYVPELVAIPPWWRVTGALSRFAVLSGLPASERRDRVESAIESMGLEEHRGKRVKQLSKGNRQRLGIAQALLSDASVVVFDEPTHGLDPVWTDRFRDLVGNLRRPDRCIVIASHNLNELERVADRVAILDHGKLTRIADLQVASHALEVRHYILELSSDAEAVLDAFPEAKRLAGAENGASWEVDGDLDSLNRGLRVLLEAGASVRSFAPRRSRLESEFHEAVGK